jgi:hypothetical protein
MAVTEIAREDQAHPRTQRAVPRSRQHWGPAHYLALAAVPLLAYQVWTLVAWLAAGPHQITAYRSYGSFSWYAARAIEVVLALALAAILVRLVRECRAQRRLTFDAMLFIGLLLTVCWDTIVNSVEPLWFYSSTWLNLNDWYGHAPFVISPAAGPGPFPILMLGMLYPFFVFDAMIICNVMRRAKRRWPDISAARLVSVGLVPALLIGAILSLIMILPHLWGGAGMPLSILGGNYRWSIGELLYIGIWSMTLASVRFFVNDRGERLTERGLEHLPARRRTGIALLATIAVCNLSVIVWSSPLVLTGFKATAYPNYPRSLSTVVCDTPGLHGSAYGPCPGSPGFKLPLG